MDCGAKTHHWRVCQDVLSLMMCAQQWHGQPCRLRETASIRRTMIAAEHGKQSMQPLSHKLRWLAAELCRELVSFRTVADRIATQSDQGRHVESSTQVTGATAINPGPLFDR